MKFNISRFRVFISQERIYIWMLAFILLVNAFSISQQKPPEGEAEDEFKFEYQLSEEKRILWNERLAEKRGLRILMNILSLGLLSVFALGLFLDIRILMAKVKKRQILDIPSQQIPARWGIGDIFKLVIIFVFLGYIIHILEKSLWPFIFGEKIQLTFLPLFNTGILDLLILGFIIYFVKVKYSQNLSAMGLAIKNAGRFVLFGVLGYIAFLPTLALLLLLIISLSAIFNCPPPQQTLFKLFLQEENIWILTYSTLMVVLFGPIVEEVFFRGFAYNAIKRRYGVRLAMVATAVVFAALHANLAGFLPIMALGMLLAYMYEKTGSLVSSITIHILHNSLMLGFLFLGRYFMNSLSNF